MTTAKSPRASFLARVRDALATLHPVEKKLAEFVLDFPGDLASYSASELARLSGVSNATVTRFVRRLGYENFEAARRNVREEKQAGSPLFLAGRVPDTVDASVEAHMVQGQENLRRTFSRIPSGDIQAAAHALLGARKVWIMGMRSSQSLATYLQWQIFQVKQDIQVFPVAGGTFGEYLGSIAADDVVVVFGLRRRPARLRTILNQLIQTRARVLYITDENLGHNPRVTWHMKCTCTAPGLLDNHVAVIALCHMLANSVIELSDQAGRARLTDIETQHDALGEF